MKHEEYKEMLTAAALDALDEVERRALEAHLTDCGECRAELAALGDAAALLAYAVPPVAPAPELRAQILARAKSQPQDARREPSNGDAPASSAPAAPVSTSANVRSFDEHTARREARSAAGAVSRRLFVYGSLAASVALAALLVTLFVLWQRNARLQTELARLSQSVQQTEQELARTRADRELLAAPASHSATLAGTKVAERARARLTFDARTGQAMLMAADLPPAPAGKAYQLWYIAAGRPPMPGSVFTPDASGHAEMRDIVPPEGRSAAVIFAVTLEPAGGTSAPTGEMYLKSSAS